MPNIICHFSNVKCQISWRRQHFLIKNQLATFNIKFQMSSSNCQISNVTFQMSNFKSHVGDNSSCSTQQLIQNPVAPFRISNFKCQMSNIICHMSNVKNQMSDVNKVKLLSERTSGVPPVILNMYSWLHSSGKRQKFFYTWTS